MTSAERESSRHEFDDARALDLWRAAGAKIEGECERSYPDASDDDRLWLTAAGLAALDRHGYALETDTAARDLKRGLAAEWRTRCVIRARRPVSSVRRARGTRRLPGGRPSPRHRSARTSTRAGPDDSDEPEPPGLPPGGKHRHRAALYGLILLACAVSVAAGNLNFRVKGLSLAARPVVACWWGSPVSIPGAGALATHLAARAETVIHDDPRGAAMPQSKQPPADLAERNRWFASLSSSEQQAQLIADVADMHHRSSYFDGLDQQNRAYVRQRTRQQAAPARPRPPGCGPRRRERRDGSRRHATRAGPSDADGSGLEPPAPARLCVCGCGRDISHKRAGARTFDSSCRSRLSRQSSKPTVPPHRCNCQPGALATVDPDGDLVCAKCGRYRSQPRRRPNSFDALARLMQTDSDGQPYRVARSRPPSRWRDTQPRAEVAA